MSSYTKNLAKPSDIQEHLGLLHGLAMEGNKKVVEFGFRTGISTSAFLAAGAHVTSYDIDKASCRPYVKALAAEYPDTFAFYEGDSREVDIPDCDLLFIDSDHTYATTLIELRRHWMKVRGYIVLHDTTTFGHKDREPGKGPGIYTAIRDWETEMESETHHPPFRRFLTLRNNNGLTVLEKLGRTRMFKRNFAR